MLVTRPGKDEMNLAEFPITLLSARVPAGQKIIEYQDQIFDERSNRTITRKLTIKPAEGSGLPTAVDDDLILALIQLTKANNGFTSRRVDFSRLDLIRMLGWPDSGASYKRLATSLTRWLGVTLVYENAWWDRRQQAWVTKGFHIIDNFELNDSRTGAGQDELFPSSIQWNQVVFESFEAGYLKSIDYDFYMNLDHPTARRMYRFLSKRMYHRAEWTFDLKDLAFEHVGLSRNYASNAGKIKEKLQPAIDELETAGFLEPAEKDDRYIKEGKTWRIRLTRKASALNAGESANAVAVPLQPLVAELMKRGVHPETAIELAQFHGFEEIHLRLEIFDWLIGKNDRKVASNPAGFLISSILKSYTVPKGFLTKTERDRLVEQRRKKEHGVGVRRPANRQDAREQAEYLAIDAYWKALTPQQRAELQAKADSAGNPADLALESGPLRAIGQQIRRQAYLSELLKPSKPDASGS